MIKKFENFNKGKSIAVFHGLGGDISPDRIALLKSEGYDVILYDHIDFEMEWDKDKCKSLFQNQLSKVKDIDLIMGFSLGGYLAFELAGYLSKNLILVNPALDRDKTRLNIKYFDIIHKRNFKKIEVFLGENDTLIDKSITIDYLNINNIDFTYKIIGGMEHRTPIEYFTQIINKSKLIK